MIDLYLVTGLIVLFRLGKSGSIMVFNYPLIKRAMIAYVNIITEYSLWTRSPETDVLPVCRELGISLVAYAPLGSGFLTGTIKSPDDFAPNDFRRNFPRFQGENFQHNLELVDKVKEIAQEKDCTPAQLALAWLLAQGEDIIPIPGTTKSHRVEENARAAEIELTPEDLSRIDEIAPHDVAKGTRYPEAMMSTLNI